jgi:hypothetical protein
MTAFGRGVLSRTAETSPAVVSPAPPTASPVGGDRVEAEGGSE